MATSQVEIFQGISLSEITHFFYCNGLAVQHGFPDIMYIKVNNGHQPAILNLIQLIFFRAYPYLKSHIFG